jgi:hypothetical protein
VLVKARTKPVLPDGTTAILEVLDAEQVSGSFGPQLMVKLQVKEGKYAGFEFIDWSKLQKDPESREVFVEIGTKAGEIFESAFGDEYEVSMDHDPQVLIGRRLMSRIGLAGKKQDRNRLEYGSLGPDPGKETEDDLQEQLPF